MPNSSHGKDHQQVAKSLKAGKTIGQALIDGGYTPNSVAKQGPTEIIKRSAPLRRALGVDFSKYIKTGRNFTAQEIEDGVMGFLVRSVESRDDKGVLAAKALGSARKVNMFVPDVQQGVIVVNMPESLVSAVNVPKLELPPEE